MYCWLVRACLAAWLPACLSTRLLPHGAEVIVLAWLGFGCKYRT